MSSAVSLAKRTKIPSVVIGATIVSVATTLPEILVSVIASINGQFDMAVGNGVGTIIANIAFICGISVSLLPMMVKRTSNIKYFILLFLNLFLVICGLNGKIDLYEAIILVVAFVFFIIVNIIEAKKESKRYPQEEDDDITELKEIMPWKVIIPLFIIGALSIGFGAMTLVKTGSFLASKIGISEEIIGLTIIALGTSLPELVTAIISIRKKESALGYGNIIGANIINFSLLIGLSGIISGSNGLPITKQTSLISLPLSLFVTLIFTLPLIFTSKTYRWQGVILLLSYLIYIVFLIMTTLQVVVVK